MQTRSETTHTLEVYGRTWEGRRGLYTYSVDALITDDATARRVAGDFAELLDWRCVRVEHVYEWNPSSGLYRRTDHRRAVRGFRNGMTPRRFYRLLNS